MKVKLVNAGEFGPLYMEYVPDTPEQLPVESKAPVLDLASIFPKDTYSMFDIAAQFPDNELEITKVDGGHIVRVKDMRNITTDLRTYREMSSGFFVGDVYFNNPYKITKT